MLHSSRCAGAVIFLLRPYHSFGRMHFLCSEDSVTESLKYDSHINRAPHNTSECKAPRRDLSAEK
jgi:hypothetical protein